MSAPPKGTEELKAIVKISDSAMFSQKKYPSGTIRTCVSCKFANVVKAGTYPGYRGYGFVAGNKARGEMIQHFKQAHPERYQVLLENARVLRDERLAKQLACAKVTGET
jgi:hypothetical protein